MITHILRISEKVLSYPNSIKLFLAINIMSLVFAMIMQYGFDVYPCILCLWQRVPFGATAVICLLMLLLKTNAKKAYAVFLFCSLMYMGGMGTAIFHTGVERHWWAGTSSCSLLPVKAGSAEDLRQSLLKTVLPPCDEITWDIFGLTIANLNILASLGMAALTAAAALQSSRSAKNTQE